WRATGSSSNRQPRSWLANRGEKSWPSPPTPPLTLRSAGPSPRRGRAPAGGVQALGGGIDVLANAPAEPAGYATPPQLGEITGAFFQRELDTKVMGYIRCA